jgi:hypothetical protein
VEKKMNWSAIAAVASAVIALSALGFSVVSFNRQQERAREQQKAAEALAVASVKPFLWIEPLRYLDLKVVTIKNHGLGPAILRHTEFSRESGPPTNNMVELFDLRDPRNTSKRIVWERFDSIEDKRVLPVQGEIIAIRQSLKHLVAGGINDEEGYALLREWQRQLGGIRLHIEYDDVLGNHQKPIDIRFRGADAGR